MSWILAIGLALPLSAAISAFLGDLLFDEAFPLVVSITTLGIWLAMVSCGAILASVYPAWKASQLSIRETFAH